MKLSPATLLREVAPRALTRLGLDAFLHILCGSPSAILMYHGVVPRGTRPRLWTQLELPHFTEQMRYLADHRPVVDLETLVRGLAGAYRLPPGAVAITFDDGYFNVLEHAMPVLERYRLPATVFVTTGLTGTDTLLWTDQLYERLLTPDLGEAQRAKVFDTVRRLKQVPDADRVRQLEELLEAYGGKPRAGRDHPRRMMDTRELRALVDTGLITLGAHGVTHALLTQLPPERAESEIRRSKAQLEAFIGRPVRYFAYPDGACDSRTARLVRQAGYEAAVTTEMTRVRAGDDLFLLGRYPVGGSLPLERFSLLLAGVDEVRKELRRAGRWRPFPVRRALAAT